MKTYVRDTNLDDLPRTVAYRVDGVHLYADILNLEAMLNVTAAEGETCHRRTLRFLNLRYRAVHRILQRVDALFVDFHNQRLHSVVAKPYGSEISRIHRAVAISQFIIDVLARTGEDAVDDPDVNPLSAEEIEDSRSEADLGVEVDDIVSDWEKDLEKNPIGSFEFTSHTPPFSILDLEALSVRNSRRQDAATVYADIDGFTAYVSENIATDPGGKDVVRALHVIRSELDSVLPTTSPAERSAGGAPLLER